MQIPRSHGRLISWLSKSPSKWNGGTRWSVFLGLVAFGSALGMGLHLWNADQEKWSRNRFQIASEATRNLRDVLETRVEALRNQLLANPVSTSSSVTFFQRQDELQLKGVLYRAVWIAGSRERVRYEERAELLSTQKDWIRQMHQGVPWMALMDASSSMVRGEMGEWLAFYFKSGSSVVGALVDPSEFFSIPPEASSNVSRNASRNASRGRVNGSRSAHSETPDDWRAYLVADDGRVLVHSKTSLQRFNISASEVFQRGLAGALRGGRPGGVGRYRGADDAVVTAAYARLEPVNLVVAVELREPSSLFSSFQGESGNRVAAFALFSLVFSFLTIAAIQFRQWLLGRKKIESKISIPKRQFEDAPPPVLGTHQLSPQPSEKTAGTHGAAFGGDTFILSEIRPVESTVFSGASTHRSAPADLEIDSQIVERAFYRELQSDPSVAREEQLSRIRISRLERELEQLAGFLDDVHVSRLFADRVVTFVSGLIQGPALYFRVHLESKQAILEAVEGLDAMDSDIVSPGLGGGLSFPLISEQLVRTQETIGRGSILPLTDYGPLAQLIRLRFAGASFQAWAIQGDSQDGSGREGNRNIHGVLVVVAEDELIRRESEAIARVIRGTGQLYDHATLG